MKYFTSFFIIFMLLVTFPECKGPKSSNMEKNISSSEHYYVTFHTTSGDITVKLSNDTPRHRDNFLKLTEKGYFNGVLFHRVIQDFMIQSGDPDSKNAPKGKLLGNGGPGYTIPAEICKNLFHKKGALAAARTGDRANPERASSGSQFYIVQGKTFLDAELNQIEKRINQSNRKNIYYYFQKQVAAEMKNSSRPVDLQQVNQEAMIRATDSLDKYIPFRFGERQRNVYKTTGGTPHLDAAYTVFGEVVKGLDIVDKIASVSTDNNDRPFEDIKILHATVTRK